MIQLDVSNTHYWSDECPTRHTGAAFHASSNRVDVPPRSIPMGLPEMVDAEHRLVHHQIQLPVYYSPVPDTHILFMDTLAISGWYWMHTPICLPYSSQKSYSGSKNSAAASCSSLKLAPLSVVPRSIVWDIPVPHHYQIGIDFFFIDCPNSTT